MDSFKRLCPYVGPNIPEQVRQNARELWPGIPDFEYGQWEWTDGSGIYQCEIELCDMDSEVIDAAGYVALVPLEDPRFGFVFEPEKCWIRCVLNAVLDPEKFEAEAEVVESRIFKTILQAKEFLDSILAFPTPQIVQILPVPETPEPTPGIPPAAPCPRLCKRFSGMENDAKRVLSCLLDQETGGATTVGIARLTGLDPVRVEECLQQLRTEGLVDPLIVRSDGTDL
jgi:hypothetical protein